MSVQTTWILGLADDDQHHRQTDVAANNIYTIDTTVVKTWVSKTKTKNPCFKRSTKTQVKKTTTMLEQC